MLKNRLLELHCVVSSLRLTPTIVLFLLLNSTIAHTLDLVHLLLHVVPGHRNIFIIIGVVNHFLLTCDVRLLLFSTLERRV